MQSHASSSSTTATAAMHPGADFRQKASSATWPERPPLPSLPFPLLSSLSIYFILQWQAAAAAASKEKMMMMRRNLEVSSWVIQLPSCSCPKLTESLLLSPVHAHTHSTTHMHTRTHAQQAARASLSTVNQQLNTPSFSWSFPKSGWETCKSLVTREVIQKL